MNHINALLFVAHQNPVTAQIACYFVQEQGESAEFTDVNEHFQRRYWTK
jgi:hypothetical protein